MNHNLCLKILKKNMPEDIGPRVILNEEYLDLRNPTKENNSIRDRKTTTQKSSVLHRTLQSNQTTRRVVDLNNEGLRYEKELINCGLKKLATSYNATSYMYNNRKGNSVSSRKKSKLKEKSFTDPRFRKIVVVPQGKFKSQSEFSLPAKNPVSVVQCISPNSTPIIQTVRTAHIETKPQQFVSKYTMTLPDDVTVETRVVNSKKRSRSLSKARSGISKSTDVKDSRLCKKHSILKLPWQRSWTLPAFTTKSSLGARCDLCDNSDRQTYLYDDGTEIDSMYLEEKQTKINEKALQKQCMLLLFLCGSICGILLVSLLIWFIFGNNFLNTFFKPRRVQEGTLKKSFKYLGGGILYMITRIFESLGYVLALPTQKVYQSEPEYYRWPMNPVQLPN